VKGPGITPVVVPILNSRDEDYTRWRESNVRPQKQFGFSMATATIPLGDLTSEQMRVLGELALAYGDGTVRVTPDQNLLFRWVNACDVRQLYSRLAAAGLGLGEAGTVADVASCPGAETCRLAVTQSRGLGRLLEDRLRARPDLIAAADGARIKISGCPNGCGQHHIGGIGFQGSLRKVGGQPAPHYFVMVGGGVADGLTTFGRHAATIPARRCDQALDRLIGLYQAQHGEGENAVSFFRRVDLATVKSTLAGLDKIDPATATSEDFIDLAEDHAFQPVVSEGECAV
jgi:sulfite reductase beta subunit-like hemoprotein